MKIEKKIKRVGGKKQHDSLFIEEIHSAETLEEQVELERSFSCDLDILNKRLQYLELYFQNEMHINGYCESHLKPISCRFFEGNLSEIDKSRLRRDEVLLAALRAWKSIESARVLLFAAGANDTTLVMAKCLIDSIENYGAFFAKGMELRYLIGKTRVDAVEEHNRESTKKRNEIVDLSWSIYQELIQAGKSKTNAYQIVKQRLLANYDIQRSAHTIEKDMKEKELEMRI